jgi:hypothetical protein
MCIKLDHTLPHLLRNQLSHTNLCKYESKTVRVWILSKFTDIPYNNGTKNKVPNTRPIGIYFIVFFDRLFNLDSSIIIANKNKTAIAPT